MSRRKSVTDREVPSIIQEIVIYDKPNKPVVPQEIFPETSNFTVGQGDIVLSRSQDVSPPTTKKVKSELFEEEKIIEEESETEELDESSLTIKTEIFSSEEDTPDDDLFSEAEESIENISKEISKSNLKPIGETDKEKQTNTIKNEKPAANKKKAITPSKQVQVVSKETTPFKRPRGRPRKSISMPTVAPQKPTILHFVIKHPKNNQQIEIEPARTNSIIAAPSNVLNITREKRVRRRPKKYDDEDIIMGETDTDEEEFSNTDEEELLTNNHPKRKKEYTTLTNVTEIYDTTTQEINSDNLEELMDEGGEQVRTVNEAEAELQDLVQDNQAPKPKRKPGRPRKNDQPKITDIFEKRIKKEETIDEEIVDLKNVPSEEILAHETDEDSRSEWITPEYAEYKQQHSMKINGKMHKCKFCSKEFSSYYSMRKHRALEHDDVGRDIKESTYRPPSRVEKGQEEDEESEDEDRGEWMPQDYAEYKMKHSMSKLKRTQWYKCKICCAVFSNYYKLSKHRSEEHINKVDPYECKQCGAKFGDVDALTAHIREHQGKDPYKCKKCCKGFKTKLELDKHLPIHILKKAPTPVKRFRCDICGKEFSKLCDIERHTRVHTGERPCQCNICHKYFQQSHNLSKHLLTHLHVKPFQCEICNKKFGRVDVLNRHILTHSIEKPYKCDICQKGFIRQVQLTNHMDKMHPEASVDLFEINNEVSVTPVR